jgi:phosphoribosyl-ATP pyrophosphohydrolase
MPWRRDIEQGSRRFLVSRWPKAYIASRGKRFDSVVKGSPGVNDSSSIFTQLMAVIEDRKANPSERSYTTRLFEGGVDKIGAKILEESAEVVMAAHEPGEDGRTHTIREAADVIYHLFVLLGYREIKLTEVEAELARRFGISGLDEKASRGASGDMATGHE